MDEIIFTVELSKPITDAKGEEITFLEFREPTFGDYLEATKKNISDVEAMGKLIERCGSITGPSVKQLSMKDVIKISGELEPFLGSLDEK